MICSLMCLLMAGTVITADVSQYSKLETCPRNECITASGVKPYVGSVACARGLKFGSIVVIDGLVYSCQDRLHPRFDHRIDIWAGDDEEAYQRAINYGVQNKVIQLYE